MKALDYNIEDLKIGQSAFFEVSISQKSQDDFAHLSGDYNPLHQDYEYAKGTKIGKPVVYGMYLASLISRLIGMSLPGKRSLIVESVIRFHSPVFTEDTVIVQGEISHISLATKLVKVLIKIEREKHLCIDGYIQVLML
jgi:3-hydroxybutyryl-CoA dehydratase